MTSSFNIKMAPPGTLLRRGGYAFESIELSPTSLLSIEELSDRASKFGYICRIYNEPKPHRIIDEKRKNENITQEEKFLYDGALSREELELTYKPLVECPVFLNHRNDPPLSGTEFGIPNQSFQFSIAYGLVTSVFMDPENGSLDVLYQPFNNTYGFHLMFMIEDIGWHGASLCHIRDTVANELAHLEISLCPIGRRVNTGLIAKVRLDKNFYDIFPPLGSNPYGVIESHRFRSAVVKKYKYSFEPESFFEGSGSSSLSSSKENAFPAMNFLAREGLNDYLKGNPWLSIRFDQKELRNGPPPTKEEEKFVLKDLMDEKTENKETKETKKKSKLSIKKRINKKIYDPVFASFISSFDQEEQDSPFFFSSLNNNNRLEKEKKKNVFSSLDPLFFFPSSSSSSSSSSSLPCDDSKLFFLSSSFSDNKDPKKKSTTFCEESKESKESEKSEKSEKSEEKKKPTKKETIVVTMSTEKKTDKMDVLPITTNHDTSSSSSSSSSLSLSSQKEGEKENDTKVNKSGEVETSQPIITPTPTPTPTPMSSLQETKQSQVKYEKSANSDQKSIPDSSSSSSVLTDIDLGRLGSNEIIEILENGVARLIPPQNSQEEKQTEHFKEVVAGLFVEQLKLKKTQASARIQREQAYQNQLANENKFLAREVQKLSQILEDTAKKTVESGTKIQVSASVLSEDTMNLKKILLNNYENRDVKKEDTTSPPVSSVSSSPSSSSLPSNSSSSSPSTESSDLKSFPNSFSSSALSSSSSSSSSVPSVSLKPNDAEVIVTADSSNSSVVTSDQKTKEGKEGKEDTKTGTGTRSEVAVVSDNSNDIENKETLFPYSINSSILSPDVWKQLGRMEFSIQLLKEQEKQKEKEKEEKEKEKTDSVSSSPLPPIPPQTQTQVQDSKSNMDVSGNNNGGKQLFEHSSSSSSGRFYQNHIKSKLIGESDQSIQKKSSSFLRIGASFYDNDNDNDNDNISSKKSENGEIHDWSQTIKVLNEFRDKLPSLKRKMNITNLNDPSTDDHSKKSKTSMSVVNVNMNSNSNSNSDSDPTIQTSILPPVIPSRMTTTTTTTTTTTQQQQQQQQQQRIERQQFSLFLRSKLIGDGDGVGVGVGVGVGDDRRGKKIRNNFHSVSFEPSPGEVKLNSRLTQHSSRRSKYGSDFYGSNEQNEQHEQQQQQQQQQPSGFPPLQYYSLSKVSRQQEKQKQQKHQPTQPSSRLPNSFLY